MTANKKHPNDHMRRASILDDLGWHHTSKTLYCPEHNGCYTTKGMAKLKIKHGIRVHKLTGLRFGRYEVRDSETCPMCRPDLRERSFWAVKGS